VVRRSGRAKRSKASAAAVLGITQQLAALNRSTERDFLTVGEKLGAFRTTAREIASDMAAVTESIAGEHGKSASRALTRMLEHSGEMDARLERTGQLFAQVRDHATRLRQAFSGISNMVALFRSLCTLTQIETARLGGAGAGLGYLAAEVRPLSESIQASGEGVLAAAQRLDREVQAAIRSGDELRNTQLKDIPALLAGVSESLQSFEERRRLARETSDGQAAQYAAVCAAIDDLVGSLQFHDITRQQVEHVMAALEKLETALEDGVSSPPDGRAVLGLQCSQLAGAGQLFTQSVERIERDLESIATRLENAAETVRTLTGISGSGQHSFFLTMETHFSAILKKLAGCSAAQAEMDATTAGLGETIGRMRDSVAEIRGTEIQIQRISINATIRAIHLGTAGVALNKIAEVMQRLALESNSSTELAAATLEAMSQAAGSVSGSAPEPSTAQATTDQVTGEMQRALGELHSTSESSFSRVNHIAALSAQLARDIGAVRGGLSAGRMFAEVIGRVRSELEELGAQAAAESGHSDAAAEQLKFLAQSYTMQAQRDVHESFIGAQAMAVAADPATPKSPAGENDLGDNFQLF
jgi:hypothetical protein